MPDTLPCLRCGSDTVVPDAEILNAYGTVLTVRLARPKPNGLKALISTQNQIKVETRARICGDCGFIELYATKPGEVWDDHLTRTTER